MTAGSLHRHEASRAPRAWKSAGARLDFDAYAPERRAMRLAVESREVAVTIRPGPPCVNPVFELIDAPKTPAKFTLAGQTIDPKHVAWDGRTLWLDATIVIPTEIRIVFAE